MDERDDKALLDRVAEAVYPRKRGTRFTYSAEGMIAEIERLRADNARLSYAPLCGEHAATWYTARPTIDAPQTGCIFCDWTQYIGRLQNRNKELEKALERPEPPV